MVDMPQNASRSPRSYGFKFYGGLFVAVFGAFLLVCAAIAQSPDFQMSFHREVPSKDSPELLGAVIDTVPQWIQWFHQAEDAKAIDAAGRPYSLRDQHVQKGSLVRLYLDPHRGPWGHFQILLTVEEYVPNRLIRLRVLEDSKGKLTKLFKNIEWTVELVPSGTGTLIRGDATAETAHWRARVFGRLMERVVMNQVFFPDLLRLSDLTREAVTNPMLPGNQ